jgi:hypothetical protein
MAKRQAILTESLTQLDWEKGHTEHPPGNAIPQKVSTQLKNNGPATASYMGGRRR